MTTQNEIRGWLLEGKKKKNLTHMLVVCDTFDWEDYPVYVFKNENVRNIYEKYNGPNMQTVMEVYSLKKDIEKQLKEHRSFNFD